MQVRREFVFRLLKSKVSRKINRNNSFKKVDVLEANERIMHTNRKWTGTEQNKYVTLKKCLVQILYMPITIF